MKVGVRLLMEKVLTHSVPMCVSSGDKFQVLDSCTRAMLRTEDLEDQGQMLASVFNLKLLENQEDRPVSYMLKTSSM